MLFDEGYAEVDTERLIVLIQERPVLYNYTMKDHHNKDIVNKMWEEIGKELKISVTECKRKWHSLRNSFTRHLRDEKNPPPNCLGPKKKWYLANAMDFLRNYIGQCRKNNIVYNEENLNDSDSFKIEIDDVSQVSANEFGDDFTGDWEKSEDDNTQNSIQHYVPSNPPSPSTKVSKRKKIPPQLCQVNATEKTADQVESFLRERRKRRLEVDSSESYFFKSIIPDMMQLSNKRLRQFKLEVMRTLYKHLDEQENECLTTAHSSSIPSLPHSMSILPH